MIVIVALLLHRHSGSIEVLQTVLIQIPDDIRWIPSIRVRILRAKHCAGSFGVPFHTKRPPRDTSCYPACWRLLVPGDSGIFNVDVSDTPSLLVVFEALLIRFLGHANWFVSWFQTVGLGHLGRDYPLPHVLNPKAGLLNKKSEAMIGLGTTECKAPCARLQYSKRFLPMPAWGDLSILIINVHAVGGITDASID